MVLLKVVGVALIVLGFWLVKLFPGIQEYQKAGFTKTGIFAGLLLLLLGLILLVIG